MVCLVDKVENFGNTTGIRVKSNDDTQNLLRALLDHNVIVNKFDANEISLHEIFVSLAGTEVEVVEKEVKK